MASLTYLTLWTGFLTISEAENAEVNRETLTSKRSIVGQEGETSDNRHVVFSSDTAVTPWTSCNHHGLSDPGVISLDQGSAHY